MLNIKPFKQAHAHCGPACLKMVLDYYGIKKTESEISKICKTNNEGTLGENIVKAAQKFGLKAIIKDNSSPQDIRNFVLKKKIPVIFHWFSEYVDHYSIIVDIDSENYYYIDPDFGELRAKRTEDLKYIWFGFNGDYPQKNDDFILRRLIIIEQKK